MPVPDLPDLARPDGARKFAETAGVMDLVNLSTLRLSANETPLS